jgi:hypothetical protein
MYKKAFGFLVFAIASSFGQQMPVQPTAPVADKPRVFITDSQSWETSGSAGGANGAFAAHSSGGARPQTAEIIKTFGEKCPSVMVNNIQSKANYIVVLDHEGGKGYLRHKNKVAVFDSQSGDSIVSKSTLSLGGSVEEACRGIAQHWTGHNPSTAATLDRVSATKSDATVAAEAPDNKQIGAHLNVASIPDNADIEIDGNFVGNTPSSLQLAPGDHIIVVKKTGYKGWQRKMKVAGGDVSVKAELEKDTEAAK